MIVIYNVFYETSNLPIVDLNVFKCVQNNPCYYLKLFYWTVNGEIR